MPKTLDPELVRRETHELTTELRVRTEQMLWLSRFINEKVEDLENE